MKRIAIFCGSNKGARPAYTEAAAKLGELLARERIELVYGGGMVGLMKLPDLRVVKDMHERKALMAELADGFIALPGGYGTFEEFCEVLAWSQLGYHRKPFGLLDAAGFYAGMLEFFDHATREGFIKPKHRELVMVEDDAEKLLVRLENFRPPAEVKWVR